METLNSVLNSGKSTIEILLHHLKSVNRYIVKSDEQEIACLLNNEKDKIAFQKKIDEMLKQNKKSAVLQIKNREIKISL